MTSVEFAKFEKEYDMFLRTYNGFPYWQYLRFEIATMLTYPDFARKQKESEKKTNKFLYKCKKIILAFLMSVRNIILWESIKKSEVICFKHQTKRYPNAFFFDYWKKPTSISFFSMCEYGDASQLPLTKCFPNTVLPTLVAQIKYRIKKLFRALHYDAKAMTELKEFLNKTSSKSVEQKMLRHMETYIQKSIISDQEYEKYWRKLFLKTGCRAIVIVCYYTPEFFSAIRVAKEMGIRVVEFQHGVITGHDFYYFEDRREINNNVPDYMLVFGELQMNGTKLLDCTKAIVTGYPYHDQQVRQVDGVETEENLIIIYPDMNLEFEQTIDKFVNIAVSKGFRIIMKMHPNECENIDILYPLLSKNKNIQIIAKTDKSIYYWLKKGRHHIMVNSTVGLEACSFDHCNICVGDFVATNSLQFIVNAGMARMFHTEDELLEMVLHPMTLTPDMKDRIYMSNAEQSVPRFFEELKRQGWPLPDKFVWK